MSKLDVTKPVQTRDGRSARIVCTDFKRPNGKNLIVVTMSKNDDEEFFGAYYPNGRVHQGYECTDDIINVVETITKLVYFYRNEKGNIGVSTMPPNKRSDWMPFDEALGSKLVTFTVDVFEDNDDLL